MNNFWVNLPKPFTILAPMEDVTDTVLRQMLLRIGRPNVFFTEFVNVDGLQSKGSEKVVTRLKYIQQEKPIVAQLWGNNPENFFKSAKLVQEKNFDGIDINLGCSQKNVMQHNCGAALIDQENLVEQIIKAVKKGAPNLPISVKTRLGVKQISFVWFKFLLKQNLAAITIHGRLSSDSYNIAANWEEIGKIVKLRNSMNSQTLIIGNGDVVNFQDGLKKVDQYKTDGFAIARGILHDPFAFVKKRSEEFNVDQRLKLLVEHASLYYQTWGDQKSFATFKKFIKMYIQNFPEAVKLRTKLMNAENYQNLINLTNVEIK